MSDPPPPQSDDNGSASTPVRRARAPTITIDTSAVNPQDAPAAGGVPRFSTDGVAPDDTSYGNMSPKKENGHSPELQGAPSFDSRPTSPHNVSSPTQRYRDTLGPNFLAVPGARSRGSSIDSSEPGSGSSSLGGETYFHSEAATSPEQTANDPTRNDNIINSKDALEPDSANDPDFFVEDNKFAFTPGQLNKLINPKSMAAFYKLGGLGGLEKGLRTSRHTGLGLDESKLDGTVTIEEVNASLGTDSNAKPPRRSDTGFSVKSKKVQDDSYFDRKRIYKDNRLPEKKAKSFLELAWLAYNDKVLILLSVAAVISLALGIYQSVTATDGEARVQWVEGVAIIVAIVIVVLVGAANDYQKERQFVKLNKKKDDRVVKVVRSGKTKEISVHDVLAGDVMHLEAGDLIPVDGIFITGHDVKCDESSATGESDILRKTPADDVYDAITNHKPLNKLDPFIISGGKVSEGVGTFLVTSVGVNSSYGKTMMSLQDEGQTTPLQSKLNVLAEYIAKLGLASGLLLFVVLFIKFLVQLKNIEGGAKQKGQEFLQIFIVAVTVVVVAVPEGLPLAVTLALAFATTRMLKDNNLVRLLRACETMGNATTVCSDKTGTLTENKMTVVSGSLGTSSRFGDKPGPDATAEETTAHAAAYDVSPSEFVKTLSTEAQELLKDSIVLNSTAFEGEIDGVPAFIGSKTESALLGFAREHMGLGPVEEERANAEIAQLIPFDSGRKCMAVAIKLGNGKYRLLVKGAAEILLSRSNTIIRDPTKDTTETALTENDKEAVTRIINSYAERSLRAIGMLYRDYEQWPPRGAAILADDPNAADFDKLFKNMTLLGIFGIQDPLRQGVAEAVKACMQAGVFVRMVTGDNLVTAKAIASECGIFTPGGIAMEGPVFRKLSEKQMDQVLPRLQVLARSSPNDKKVLVSNLKRLGETVAVTGDGTNDAPALKTADVGFSMGIAGTEVAKEASAIILMDDNFASIVKAISWGRTVNDAVKKFLQFQLTVNITAVVLTFVSAVASGDENSVLTAVQLLWVNLIMDTFAALALATDPPTPDVLYRKPEPKSAPLITITMWKMIIGQAIYQLVVTFIIHFAGKSIFGYSTATELGQLNTIVFNTFVWMQIFNQYNCRRLDNKFNIFQGMFKNRWFLGIQVIIVAGQVLIVFFGGAAFAVNKLKGVQWAYCLILGAISVPVAVVIRLVPDELFAKLIPRFPSRGKTANPQLLITDDQRYAWNPALEEIREELTFLKRVRGGRLSQLRYKLQHPTELLVRSRSNSRSNSIPQTPVLDESASNFDNGSPMPPTPESRSRIRTRSRSNSAFGPAAAMAGIVAGSIAAGWSPIERQHSDQESITITRSRSNSHLEPSPGIGIEVHPGTAEDDPVISEHPVYSNIPPSQNPDLAPSSLFEGHDRRPSTEAGRSRGRSQHSRHSSRSGNGLSHKNSD